MGCSGRRSLIRRGHQRQVIVMHPRQGTLMLAECGDRGVREAWR